MAPRTLPTLAALAMLSGCGTISLWDHPTHDGAQFAQDRYVCIYDGEQHAAGLGSTGDRMIVTDRADECMRVQGYTVTKARRMTGAPTEPLKRPTSNETGSEIGQAPDAISPTTSNQLGLEPEFVF